jgi:glycosyltransferase involved in cell wall biosynthesis
MKQQPLVSVVIPTYNRAGIIRETIDNVLLQTYPNIEVIVVDDGSTDGTQAVLSSYGSRLRWIAQKNAGPGAARNRGIAMAHGEIIAFQDSDDVWHPTKIERQVSALERAGKSAVCCICNCIKETAHRTTRSFDDAPIIPPIDEGLWLNPAEVLSTRFVLFNQAVAIRRTVLERIGGFDESFWYNDDDYLELRLALEGPWAFIREPLATRQHRFAGSVSQQVTHKILSENQVRVRETILRVVERENRLAALRPIMQGELRRARRGLRAVQLQESNVFWISGIGWCLEQIEQYRMAAYRRTPWFPKMKVAALGRDAVQDAVGGTDS